RLDACPSVRSEGGGDGGSAGRRRQQEHAGSIRPEFCVYGDGRCRVVLQRGGRKRLVPTGNYRDQRDGTPSGSAALDRIAERSLGAGTSHETASPGAIAPSAGGHDAETRTREKQPAASRSSLSHAIALPAE